MMKLFRKMSRIVFILSLTLFGYLSILVISLPAYANLEPGVINLSAGASYDLGLYSERNASMWAGLRITQNSLTLDESNLPFLTLGITSAGFGISTVLDLAMPGINHNDEYHYYVALQESTFNVSMLRNVSIPDLDFDGMFSESLYPQFDIEYNILSENPNTTLCCDISNITFAGIDVLVFNITILPNSTFYVGKYNNGTHEKPIFISQITNHTCYTVGICVSQMLLPTSPTAYNFYSIHRLGAYSYDIYIDGRLTTMYSRSGSPHNVSVTLRNLYGGFTMANNQVILYEQYGNELFVPNSGIFTESFGIGYTDLLGNVSFLSIPTSYPSVLDNYSVGVATLVNDTILSRQPLSINITTNISIANVSHITQQNRDTAKILLSSYIQLFEITRKQVNELFESRELNITYNVQNNQFSYEGNPTVTNFTVSSGAVHLIRVLIVNNTQLLSNYSWRIKTNNSALLFVPESNNQTRSVVRANSNQTRYIIPSIVAIKEGNFTLEIYDESSTFINAVNATTIGYEVGGVSFQNDTIAIRVNAIGQMIANAHTSLEFDN